ncbi:MAG: peptidoglycan-binding protein, partial [Oscillibacter sp.]|nr:peptidoglycan-binding protein [Oscillibacter sp.]
WAENVTVSFPDYVKNVASSEIYPTWEPAAIRANVLAIISFALNRVYTEFYPSRGYDFQITSSTAYDQKFIKGRNIFENVSEIVDDIFNNYLRRQGDVEPLAAKFCNGTTVTCDGLSQWGSQELAQQGVNSIDILRRYYGPEIEVVANAPIQDIVTSYPGEPLRIGSVGDDVAVVQYMLNRISRNYPAIPKISPVTGAFGEPTEAAVRAFQRIFSLTPDGVVGKATWYKLVLLYVGVEQLAELVSQGQNYYNIQTQFPGVLREGSSGNSVRILQYMLSLLSQFSSALLPLTIDGAFGPRTTQAVRQYHSMVGLTPDGIVGENTWRSLYRHASQAYFALSRDIRSSIAQAAQAVPAMAQMEGGPEGPGRGGSQWEQARLGQFPGWELSIGQRDNRREDGR